MEDLKIIFDFVLELFKMPFTIYGFTFSFWNIIVWSLVAGFVIFVVVKLFNAGGE